MKQTIHIEIKRNYTVGLIMFMLLFTVFSGTAYTQAEYHTETIRSEERTDRLKKASQEVMKTTYRAGNDYTLPITIHIFHNSDGSGGIQEADVRSALCGVMDKFSEYGINPYLNSIEHINNTAFYTNFQGEAMLDLLFSVDNTINIMIIDDPFISLCASNFDFVNLIVFYRGGICFDEGAITRMLGFYFGLEETFNGLDGTGLNCGVQILDGEKVDGSNCMTTRDFICDTPPDYMSSPWTCDTNGEGCLQYDPNGVGFMPDGTNFMSASNSECKNKFTPMQVDVMKYIIDTEHQDLYTLPVPSDLDEFTDNTTLITPVQGGSLAYNQVSFTWTPVTGATDYYLEINRTPNFNPSFVVETTSVGTNEYTSTILQPGLNYYWRVQPYNSGFLCAPFSSTGNFSTNNMTTSNEEVNQAFSFEIYPNPAKRNQWINIELLSDQYQNGMLQLYNAQGQQIHQQKLELLGQKRFIDLDINGLDAGLYMVSVQLGTNTLQRKLIIGQ